MTYIGAVFTLNVREKRKAVLSFLGFKLVTRRRLGRRSYHVETLFLARVPSSESLCHQFPTQLAITKRLRPTVADSSFSLHVFCFVVSTVCTHPLYITTSIQAVFMFLGELSCLAAFYILLCHDRRRPTPTVEPGQSFNPFLFLPPAICDMAGTSIMYVALNMTSASSFQMLRGAVIIFTGLLSVAFLGRRLAASQWIGIFITILGLVVVGLADFVSSNREDGHKLSDVITGDLLIIMAQIIVSVQMVLEEKFIYKHNVHPLKAVGTEGFFGFVILTILLIPMFYIPAGSFGSNPRQVLEDALDAFCQIGHKPLIILALVGNTVSIAFFNFAGISVTKEISATTRMVLDSLRTLVIWVVSLALGWESFHGLQILGFLILLLGTALYNGLHKPVMARLPCWSAERETETDDADERERLLGTGRAAQES